MSERLTQRTERGTAVFNNVDIGNIAKKLCDIEDKIEQGKIVELPCRVGQTIYVITTDSPTRIEETKISQVVVRLKGNGKPQYSILAPCVYDDWGKAKWSFCDNNFGTDFFFDRASAEAKVREMEEITMSRDKQNEIHELAKQMSEAISTEVEQKYIMEEAKLEAVLRANGWVKAEEIFAEIEKLAFEVETYGHFYALGIGYGTFAELKKKYESEKDNG